MKSWPLLAVVAISVWGIMVMPSGSAAQTDQEIATARFEVPAWFADVVMLPGEYRIVHDDAKKANGEPCLSIWRAGEKEPLAEIHCERVMRERAAATKVSLEPTPYGLYRVTEVQFAGDPFGHRLVR